MLKISEKLRFKVLTAASMKTAVFWVVLPCSLIEPYRRFRGACCLHHQGMTFTVAVSIFEPKLAVRWRKQKTPPLAW
jgi:hypothetical protein